MTAPPLNKLIAVIALLASAALLGGCAHKSGHIRRNRETTTMTAQSETQRNVTNAQSQAPKPATATSTNSAKLDGPEIFRRYNQAVFMVFTTDGTNTYQGSGFFIGTDGLAVSNYHVFKGTGIGMEAIKLANDNERAYKVSEIYHRSEEEDFIIFRVDCQNSAYIPLASTRPSIGEKVFAIGSPRGLENTFSSGEVSQWRGTNLMQISALIDHGSSGGALINERGEAVGITSGSFADGSQANLNYAWSIEAIKPYLK